MAKKKKEKVLSEAQMRQMEVSHAEKKIRKHDIKEVDYKKRIASLELELTKVSVELKLVKLELEKRTLIEKDNSSNIEHKKFVDDIRDEHKIEGNFGYNPDTGEII